MALTRANVEVILISRLSNLLTEAGLDGTTNDGTNTDLNDPIGWAIRQADGSVDDFTLVDDTDVARVGSGDYDKLLDLAEYRTLENISGNLDEVDIKSGPFEQKYSQLADRVEKRLERVRAHLEKTYDFGGRGYASNIITLDRADSYSD